MKQTTTAALNTCFELCTESHNGQKDATVTTYCDAVEYLVETYGMDDVITENDAIMTCFPSSSKKLPMENAESTWIKLL